MNLLVTVLPLVGVLIGAVATYLATSAAESKRWQRAQSVRWDERRLMAYMEFGEAGKQIMSLAQEVMAARDQGQTALEAELARLTAALATRQAKWEGVLLLGAAESVDAARAWHRALWRPVAYARGESCAAQQWEEAVDVVEAARDAFYDAARRDLGVAPFNPTPHLKPPS